MEILVSIRRVYGVETIYPECAKAKHFAGIAGNTTLTPRVIAHVKALGFTVRVLQTIPETL
jgi:hypothetical protein